MEIAPRRLSLPAGARLQAVLVTSGNAVAALPSSLNGVPLLAVGDATAAKARQAGFATIHSAGADAAALTMLARQLCHPEAGPLLLASGAGQGGTLAAALRAAGFRVLRRIAYAARPANALPTPAREAIAEGTIRAALFFSPATARVFVHSFLAALPPESLRDVEALAISRSTEAALSPLPWRRIRVASHPNQDELVALLQ
jgi:uroporphyrinogen-III synthase